MNAIRVFRGCGASGKSLSAGQTYRVPEEVSFEDAGILLSMKKAEAVEAPAPPAEAENRDEELAAARQTRRAK